MRLRAKLVGGLAALMLVAVIGWNYYDVSIFFHWVEAAKHLSLLRIYEASIIFGESYRAVYPPLPILLFIATAKLSSHIISCLHSVNEPGLLDFILVAQPYVVKILLKAPIIVAAVIIALLLRRRFGDDAAFLALVGIPTLMTVGMLQFDTILALFLYLSVAILVARLASRRLAIVLSAICLAIATLTKPIAAIFVVPIAMYLAKRERALYLAVFVALILAVSAPFLVVEPRAFVENVLGFHMHRPPQYSSPWSIPALLTGYSSNVVSLVNALWIPVATAAVCVVLARYRPRPGDERSLLLSMAMLGLCLLITLKVVNPDYFMWIYPLIIALSFTAVGSGRIAKLYNVFSAIGIVWPALSVVVPAMLNEPMYIQETESYVSAKSILMSSISPPLNRFITEVMSVVASERTLHASASAVSVMPIVGSVIIAVYVVMGLILMRTLSRVCQP